MGESCRYLVPRYIQERTRVVHGNSMGRPVGRLVVPIHGELVGLRAVCQHGPNLTGATASGFEHDVTAVGRPTGTLVAARVAGDLDDLMGGRIHDVNVEVTFRAAPTEGKD